MPKYFLNILSKTLLYNSLDTLLRFNILDFAENKAFNIETTKISLWA